MHALRTMMQRRLTLQDSKLPWLYFFPLHTYLERRARNLAYMGPARIYDDIRNRRSHRIFIKTTQTRHK
jgi:hypothetical protein